MLPAHSVSAQQGVQRTELQRQDLSVPGREVIQVRVDLDPGVTFPLHSHPGEEIIYVIEGEWEYQVEGKGAELATYIVEKGKPLVVLAK